MFEHMIEDKLYISPSAREWLQQDTTRLGLIIQEKIQLLAASHDMASWKQTSDVDDLIGEIASLSEEVRERDEVINHGQLVEIGDIVNGVIIGTQARIIYPGEEEFEQIEIGTVWDAKRAHQENKPGIISFTAPLARALQDGNSESNIKVNGTNIKVENLIVPRKVDLKT